MSRSIRFTGIAAVASVGILLAGCGGGGGGGGSTGGMTPPTAGSETDFANLSPTNAGYAATAASRAADARPRSGSITQSSNVNNGITVDRVSVTAQHGASRNSYSIRNGSSWSISTSDGNPVTIDATPPFDGQELYKRANGGTLYVDVYSDIEAPITRQERVPGTAGTPVEIQEGDRIEGLTLDEINARMGDGTLNGVPGVFSCDRTGGGNCPSFFGFFPIGTDWRFTPHGSGSTRTVSTPDTDYLAGGVWLFVPDNATSANDVVLGAFGDGSDPFRQSNLVALQGTADYDGLATGVYTDSGFTDPSDDEVGYWDGNVTLRADFGGRSDLGSISGSVTSIEVDGELIPGSLSLGAANIGSSDSGFFEGRLSGNVSGEIARVGLSGRWGGQFFGNSEADGKPGSVGGTLGGRSDDRSVSFVGVFGAYKRQ